MLCGSNKFFEKRVSKDFRRRRRYLLIKQEIKLQQKSAHNSLVPCGCEQHTHVPSQWTCGSQEIQDPAGLGIDRCCGIRCKNDKCGSGPTCRHHCSIMIPSPISPGLASEAFTTQPSGGPYQGAGVGMQDETPF